MHQLIVNNGYVGNLQFFYDCQDAATKDLEENHTIAGEQSHDFRSNSEDDDDLGIGEDETHSTMNSNEDALQALILQKENSREAAHGRCRRDKNLPHELFVESDSRARISYHNHPKSHLHSIT